MSGTLPTTPANDPSNTDRIVWFQPDGSGGWTQTYLAAGQLAALLGPQVSGGSTQGGARFTIIPVGGAMVVPDAAAEATILTNAAITVIQTAAMVAANSTTVPSGRKLTVILAAGGSVSGSGTGTNIVGTREVVQGPGFVEIEEYSGVWVVK